MATTSRRFPRTSSILALIFFFCSGSILVRTYCISIWERAKCIDILRSTASLTFYAMDDQLVLVMEAEQTRLRSLDLLLCIKA